MVETRDAQLPDTLQLHLDRVLAAITASREVLEEKIERVVLCVNFLRADQSKISESKSQQRIYI